MSDERKKLVDKMNNGVSRLSPVSRKLYFSLCDEFQSRHKGEKIRTAVRQYSNHIGINSQEIIDIVSQIQRAFDEIHLNTFQQFNYEFTFGNEGYNDVYLIINRVDNTAEIKRAMEIIGEEVSGKHAYH